VAKQAVLLLAHGTPETVEQIPEYLRNVVNGRPLSPHLVEEIQQRYALIGHSPLTEITFEQARLAEAELAANGDPVPVYVAMRNWHPYIPEVMRRMRADGVEEVAVLCMTPHNSQSSVGLYRRAVQAASTGMRIDFTVGWSDHPQLIEAFAERLKPAWSRLGEEVGAPVPVLFTVHSVPGRMTPVQSDQPAQSDQTERGSDLYANESRRTAALVAGRVAEIPRWGFAFQSQGASSRPATPDAAPDVIWLGPTVEETLEKIAASGVTTLLLQPIGFLADHVEILFDVDILFRNYAARLGIRLERPESLNDSPLLAKAVADLARQGLERLKNNLTTHF
jgi:ferrochelatase